MKRRNFIKTVAASTIIASTSHWSWAGDNKPGPNRIRWSMGWILWRDFQGRKVPLSEAVQDLSDLGLDGIEFTPHPGELDKYGFTPQTFMDLLVQKHLVVTAHYYSAPLHDDTKRAENIANFKELMDSCKFFGAKNMVIGPPSQRGNVDRNELIRKICPLINELGKMGADSGIKVGMHPHMGTLIQSPSEIDLAMELTDPKYVYLSPDTGHIALGGGNVMDILRKYRKRINYFHLKDVAGPFKGGNFGSNIRELGEGEIDFPAIMTFLNEIKFSGWLTVEQDITRLTPRESATISIEYINKKLKPMIS
jgi:inosose dehydratase